MTTTSNNQKEVQLLLEGLMGDRLSVESLRKKDIAGNKTKYTIIVVDGAIPEKQQKPKYSKKDKKASKQPIIEKPKEKVTITKSPLVNDRKPAVKPPMAEITNLGTY